MRLAIIGSGDLGIQIAHYAKLANYSIVGFFDDFKSKGERVEDIVVLGKIDDIYKLYSNNKFDYLFIAFGYKNLKLKNILYEEFSINIPFATIIHPSCVIDSTVQIGNGVILYPGCIIDKNVIIEDNVLINLACVIAHNSYISKCTYISPSVSLAGYVTIGKYCYIGIGTTFIDHVCINDDIQTGGGTIVVKDLRETGVYVGCPAKILLK